MNTFAIYIQKMLKTLNTSKEKLETKSRSENAEKLLLKSQGMVSQELKCVLALDGDSIYDADIKLVRHNRHAYKTSIKEQFGECYRIQQVQDCYNLMGMAAIQMEKCLRAHGPTYRAANDYAMIQDLFNLLRDAREVLTNPRRKCIEEHITNPKRKCFRPALPPDVAVSIFLRESRLILAVYLLDLPNGPTKRHELTGRVTVDCEVPWISEVLDGLSVCLNTCMFLLNKLAVISR